MLLLTEKIFHSPSPATHSQNLSQTIQLNQVCQAHTILSKFLSTIIDNSSFYSYYSGIQLKPGVGAISQIQS